MNPELDEQPFVFCTVREPLPEGLAAQCWAIVREPEAQTLILPAAVARASGLEGEQFGRITLRVHSSLDAVGFLAVLTRRLAAARIPVNVVSAFYHDHLFVPWPGRHEALRVISIP